MKKKIIVLFIIMAVLFALLSITASAITKDDVKNQVDASNKEEVSGNIFIWFICALSFLKISQKIDSFMSSLGINVGHTGGSMLGEIMLATKGLSIMKKFGGGKTGTSTGSSSSQNTGAGASGFGGAVGRMNTSIPSNGANPASDGVLSAGGLPTPPNAAGQIAGNAGNTPLALPTSQNNNPAAGQLSAGNMPLGLPLPQSNNPVTGQVPAGNSPSGLDSPQNNNPAVGQVPAGNTMNGNITEASDISSDVAGFNMENGSIPLSGMNNIPPNPIDSGMGNDISQISRESNSNSDIINSNTEFNNIPVLGTDNVQINPINSNIGNGIEQVHGADNAQSSTSVILAENNNIPMFEPNNSQVNSIDSGMGNDTQQISGEDNSHIPALRMDNVQINPIDSNIGSDISQINGIGNAQPNAAVIPVENNNNMSMFEPNNMQINQIDSNVRGNTHQISGEDNTHILALGTDNIQINSNIGNDIEQVHRAGNTQSNTAAIPMENNNIPMFGSNNSQINPIASNAGNETQQISGESNSYIPTPGSDNIPPNSINSGMGNNVQQLSGIDNIQSDISNSPIENSIIAISGETNIPANTVEANMQNESIPQFAAGNEQAGTAIANMRTDSIPESGESIPASTGSAVEIFNNSDTNIVPIAEQASVPAETFASNMGNVNTPDTPMSANIETNGGEMAAGKKTSSVSPSVEQSGTYNAEQSAPSGGSHETVRQTADNPAWYRKYSKGESKMTPTEQHGGNIGRKADIEKKMPEIPQRKDGTNGKRRK